MSSISAYAIGKKIKKEKTVILSKDILIISNTSNILTHTHTHTHYD